MKVQTKTLRVRVRDKHCAGLRQLAFEVNQVWNAANEESSEFSWIGIPGVGYINGGTSAFDLQKSLIPVIRERAPNLPSKVYQEVIAEHFKKRKQAKKNKLRWRVSSGSKRSLGWIPFKSGAIKWVNGQIRFYGKFYKVWDSYGLSQYEFRSGSFSEDARGRWYLNIVVEVPVFANGKTSAIGIDLGLKDYATCSDGTKLEASKPFKTLEQKIATAQRAKQKQRVKALHAKAANRRKDTIHKFTTNLVNNHGLIVIGDVSASKLAKTKMAKSIYDAGWSMLKTQLKYKAIGQSVVLMEVDEAYSTQTCSTCGAIPQTSPKGLDGLGIRHWNCSCCGAEHDRDINAAMNILNVGLGRQPPVVGIPVL